MTKKQAYEQVERSLNSMTKVCTILQIDKDNLNSLVNFQKKEIEQLKHKNWDLECIKKHLETETKKEVNASFLRLLGEYHYNFTN